MTMPNKDKTINKLLDHDILSVQPMTTPDYDLVNFWYTKEEIYEKFGVPYIKEKSKITPEESVCASPMNAPCEFLEFRIEYANEIEKEKENDLSNKRHPLRARKHNRVFKTAIQARRRNGRSPRRKLEQSSYTEGCGLPSWRCNFL